jgi:dihydroxynaphthoic acid synthetase
VTPYSDILYSVTGGVARLAINRPQRLNAFTGHTMAEIEHAVAAAAADRAVGVLVMTGVGDRAFSAGGDVEWETPDNLEGLDFQLGARMIDFPKPVIARINGYAIGGGNHLAYCCDLSIAADHAIFGQNGPRVASPAAGYFVSHLASIVGHKRAREMWFLCRRYTAAQALEWGLVNRVVPMAELDAEVDLWCSELLAMSPTILRLVKQSFRQHMSGYLHRNVSDMLREHAPDFLQSGEQEEGSAAFLQKRKPDFSEWR